LCVLIFGLSNYALLSIATLILSFGHSDSPRHSWKVCWEAKARRHLWSCHVKQNV